ncbi:MAG: ATP-dependent DNA helicase RecG [Rickettsiales bacterium]|nr:ATP-dependent DNA helicase RecG [Rickettsiales bacterium]
MTTPQLLLPISSLKRVGPTLTQFLSRLVGGNKVFDLLLHKPIRAEKILLRPRLFEAPNDALVIIIAKVESHVKPANSRQPYKVICYTPTGYVNLVFFKIFPSQIAKMPIGHEIAILGNLQKLSGENQIIHPQEILPASEIDKLPKINVIYPLGAAISQKFLTQKITEVLTKIVAEKNEWIDENLLKQQGWPNFNEALKNIHNPKDESDFLPSNSNRKRLAYDELLAWQIAILLVKNKSTAIKNYVTTNLNLPRENLAEKFIQSLSFDLTKSQIKAIAEISAEINSNKKMLRLLQGDVGSGKTIVAIVSCLHTISQNKQTCIIAPTTVLAKQHLAYFSKLLDGLKINCQILTSATTKKQKSKILEELAQGKIDILISTHAVLEDNVKFKNLGLAVIDEQHRFGVMQRLQLIKKGNDVDVLLMSATPIPRSLMIALYGDMDISILSEKPKNRQIIETLIMSAKKIDENILAIKRAIDRGEKIYWICPAIEENEELNLVSVKKKYDELTNIFGSKIVGLIHGKMKESEKEKVMSEFSKSDGNLKLLVATTVIEVGIDVASATIIIIENAENFGLSQLHQLRGRVGRSEKKSFCILLYGEKFGAKGKQRLAILKQSNDGFFIAEEDLKMRGSGDLLGTKQSGFPEFRIADLNFDSDLLKIAHKNAQLILHQDCNLQNPQNQKYKYLLQLFGYDDCLKIISGG